MGRASTHADGFYKFLMLIGLLLLASASTMTPWFVQRTQDRFFSLPIPVPQLVDQRQLVELIESVEVEIQAQFESIEMTLTQSTTQRKNILKAAFSGQLVPQDPNDEPASVLLERIRAEREQRASAKKVVKRSKK